MVRLIDLKTKEIAAQRTVLLSEVRTKYPQHNVEDNGDSYVLQPARGSDGPTFLELPKCLPVDSEDRLVDVTEAMRVQYDDLAKLSEVLGIRLREPYQHAAVALRWGQLSEVQCRTPVKASEKHYRLRLAYACKESRAVQVMIRHSTPISWATAGKPEVSAKGVVKVVQALRYPLDDMGVAIDFILLKYPTGILSERLTDLLG